jgi:hypothetical protein
VIKTELPVVCTFWRLQMALAPLHQFEAAWVSRLHDIWKQGAPSPVSQLKQPALYDERKSDDFNGSNGNFIARLVRRDLLVVYLQEVARARGIFIDPDQAGELVSGRYKVEGQA